jgi:type IV secretory pathway VirB9-like protein
MIKATYVPPSNTISLRTKQAIYLLALTSCKVRSKPKRVEVVVYVKKEAVQDAQKKCRKSIKSTFTFNHKI